MDAERFKSMVARLERESAAAPGAYRAKVAALALAGFGLIALLLGAAGLGLLLLAALIIAAVATGGSAVVLALKLGGKFVLLLAVPLWYLLKSSFQALWVRLPAPAGREVSRRDAPALFDAIDDMRRRLKGPRVHHVLIVDEVNAAVVQRPAFGLVGWPRNHLLLGLPLLESLPAAEALAVVAHEYGHLAGAHGRFSAFIYRLRLTWGTVQSYSDQFQGFLARRVAALVRWYAPYFNAYTFVLARAEEYRADAVSAELAGAAHAARALKRVNLVAPRHQRFLEETYGRIVHEPSPPPDLMQRWAALAVQAPAAADAARWLADALDREGQVADTHPVLRARLAALNAEPIEAAPPPLSGPSAAEDWLGPLAATLRDEFQARWSEQLATPWAERHAQAQQERARLTALLAQPERDADEDLERLQLMRRLEPATDLRADFDAHLARHGERPLAVFLAGAERLERGDAAGLDLLERAVALDADAIKPAAERAHAFLVERGDKAAAEAWAERWRARDAFESERARQLEAFDPKHELVPHGLDAAATEALRQLLSGKLQDVKAVYLARRVLPVDPGVATYVLALRITWWARQRGRQQAVVSRLAALEWPLHLFICTLDGRYAKLSRRLKALPGALLVEAR